MKAVRLFREWSDKAWPSPNQPWWQGFGCVFCNGKVYMCGIILWLDSGWELRENVIFVIFLVPLLQKTTKNRFRELSIFVSPVHFYVISTEFEKLIEHSI
jgi:hypothetical protein